MEGYYRRAGWCVGTVLEATGRVRGLYILRRGSSLLTYVGLKSPEEAMNSPGVNSTIHVSDERRVSFLKPQA